jgi:hypothetical protein
MNPQMTGDAKGEIGAAALIADPAHRQKATVAVLARAMAGARKSGRIAERKRLAAIFDHPQAAANVGLAVQLAFHTRLSSPEAVGILALSQATSGGLASRMAMFSQINLGPGGERSGPGAAWAATAWDGVRKAAQPR